MGDEIGQNTAFYYNLKTHEVEEEGQSKAKELLGPYPDRESAANALQSVRDREEVKSTQDREWRDGGER
ncbi:hypothetical protein ABIB25_003489 [Nakamurella sp. UYEF19]|uniref:hypothetical protein n=1 Tax=Nakamurella sp. UYEF19 TaxID=1756392 RepID=UPI0033937E19